MEPLESKRDLKDEAAFGMGKVRSCHGPTAAAMLPVENPCLQL